jgi:octaprenyl-diphosphate synthase
MQRLARGLERLLARAGTDLLELAGDELGDVSVTGTLLGGASPEDLAELFESDRLRVRPLLVTLSARAAGGARIQPELQHTAELLHVALVMHDAALGQPGGRRRRVARRILKRVGRSHVTVRALEVARHAGPPEALSEVIDTLRAFADGEQLARGWRDSAAVPGVRDVEDHADMHHGALLAFCCRVGALAAGADLALVGALGRYGRHFGRLWTHADDLVNLGGPDAALHLRERAEAGRPVLAVAAGATVDASVGEAWTRLVLSPELATAERLVALVQESGGIGATREAMARAGWTARQALRVIPESPYRDGLDALAAGLARVA